MGQPERADISNLHRHDIDNDDIHSSQPNLLLFDDELLTMTDPHDELWSHDDYPPGYADDDDDDPDPETCDHEEHEVDIITGRATCWRCGESWFQTDEEIAAEIERITAYDHWQRQQERPWYRFREWIGALVGAWRARLRRMRRRTVPDDDEIPF